MPRAVSTDMRTTRARGMSYLERRGRLALIGMAVALVAAVTLGLVAP